MVASATVDVAEVFDVETGDLVFPLPRHSSRSTPSPGARTAGGSRPAPATPRSGYGTRTPASSMERLTGHTGVRDVRRLVARFAVDRLGRERRHGARLGARGAPDAGDRRGRGPPGVSPVGRADPVGDVRGVLAGRAACHHRRPRDRRGQDLGPVDRGRRRGRQRPDGPTCWGRSTSATSRTVGSSPRTTSGPPRSGTSASDATEPETTLGPAAGSEAPVFLIAPSPDGELVAMVRDISSVVSVWNVETNALAFECDVRWRRAHLVDRLER